MKAEESQFHKKTLRIGVNGRFLTKPFTGIGQHTKYLFEALAKQYPEVQFIIVVPERVNITMPKNVEFILVPEKFLGSSGMRKTFWEQWQVPHSLMKHNVDLVHFPYPSNPWPRLQSSYRHHKPVCVTVHDTIPWTMPSYRRWLSTRLYQDRCLNALSLASHIFTVSKNSENEILQLCKIDPQKISLSYNAPAAIFFERLISEKKEAALRRYGINKNRPFLLYVGGYDERKNVKTLIKVFQEKIAPHFEIDLVLAGGKSADHPLANSFDEAKKAGTSPRDPSSAAVSGGKIIMTGFVEEQDLPALYQSCTVFVNLSEKEGCNLPLLEAAVTGSVIVTSNLPVHHEMIGENALFCEPHDENTLALHLEKLLGDSTFYHQQKEKMKDFHCPFSWQKTANVVMDVYKKLIYTPPL